MSGMRCPECGHLIELFGSGGGERIAGELSVGFLGKVPINALTRERADQGRPAVLEGELSDVGQALSHVADAVVAQLEPS
jgi:hypothetical protein